VNKFAVLAASLVASFALAFAVYSAESKTNTSTFPVVVAGIRLTNQTQEIPATTIFNVTTTGLYRVSGYMAMIARGEKTAFWTLYLGWADEAGVELNEYGSLNADQKSPFSYGFGAALTNILPPIPIEAIAGTPIEYSVTRTPNTAGGTYELFLTVEELQ
jgi:hypothetical protein